MEWNGGFWHTDLKYCAHLILQSNFMVVLQNNGKGYYCEVKACTGDIKCFLLVNFGRIYIDKVHVILKYSLHLFLYCISLPIINGPRFLRLAKKCSDAALPYWSKEYQIGYFCRQFGITLTSKMKHQLIFGNL